MAVPENRVKAALAQGRVQTGLWLTLSSANVAELAGWCGFDWCLVDAEHAPNSLATMQAQLQALGATPTAAMLRVAANDPVMIKQALDLGVQSLVVPLVHDAAGAARAVAATRYPPDGIRGMGAAVARAGRWGAWPDHVATVQAQIMVIVQAESAAAAANVDAIAATDGVDGVFIGPADLSADMGFTGQPDHPEVRAAMAHVVARTRAHGKAAGILTGSDDDAAFWLGQGVNLLAVGADATCLRGALQGLAARTAALQPQ